MNLIDPQGLEAISCYAIPVAGGIADGGYAGNNGAYVNNGGTSGGYTGVPWGDIGNAYREGSKEGNGTYNKNDNGKKDEKKPKQKHHVHPKYLGGDPKGKLSEIFKDYHQKITNAFRKLFPYKKGGYQSQFNNPIFQKQVQDVMKEIYEQFPLQ